MKLSSILENELIDVNLEANSKEEAIRKLVDRASTQIKEISSDKIFHYVMERESQLSTGIGEGVAIPHARIKEVEDFIVTIGLMHKGVDFDTKDKEPVKIIILILTNNFKNNFMIQSLAAFSKLLKNYDTRENLLKAKSAVDVIRIIDRTNIYIKKTLTAKDIMRTEVSSLKLEMTMKEVVILFFTNNVQGAPVVNDKNEIIGELAEFHILKIGLPEYISMLNDLSFLQSFEPFEEFFKKEEILKVKDIYSKEFVAVSEETSIVEIAFLMISKKARRIYVTRGKELIGLVNRHDLLTKVLYV